MNTPSIVHRLWVAMIGFALTGSALLLVGIPLGFFRGQACVAANLPAQPEVKAEGMIALSGQRLLLWDSGGRIQIGNPQAGWDGIIQLPMTGVVEVVGEGPGALVGGSLHPTVGEEIAVVVALDERGSVLSRWTWKPGIVSSVATRPGERLAVAGDAIWRLNPDATTQKLTDGGRVLWFDLAGVVADQAWRPDRIVQYCGA